MLGSANFQGGPILHIMSGNLGYQIQHHLIPDLPSNRYGETSQRVRPLCEKYGIPYPTGPLLKQYGQVLRTIHKLALPNKFSEPNWHDYPETPEVPRGRRAGEDQPDRRTEPTATPSTSRRSTCSARKPRWPSGAMAPARRSATPLRRRDGRW
ncbi:MAG: fatty acid desaturase [Marmoricola sp.]